MDSWVIISWQPFLNAFGLHSAHFAPTHKPISQSSYCFRQIDCIENRRYTFCRHCPFHTHFLSIHAFHFHLSLLRGRHYTSILLQRNSMLISIQIMLAYCWWIRWSYSNARGAGSQFPFQLLTHPSVRTPTPRQLSLPCQPLINCFAFFWEMFYCVTT